MSGSNDPLNLVELEPAAITAKIEARDNRKGKAPSELDIQKEARLAEKEKRLANSIPAPKKGAPVATDVPAPPPKPPKFDRSTALDKITAYRERFPQLKKRNNVSGKSSDDEIRDELHFIEMQLGSAPTGANMVATALYAGAYAIEKFTKDYWNPLGLNLNGLATVTQQNMPEFQPLLDELMIKHSAGHYTSPEWRLALAMGATIITVNAANNNPDVARAMKAMHEQVNLKPKFADL